MVNIAHMTHMTHRAGFVPAWDIHDRIAKARRSAGLEQGELAELAGVSRKSVSNWEIGKSTPRRAAVIAIAFATGVSLEWLEKGETPAEGPGGGSAVRHQGIEPRTHCITAIPA